MVNKIRFRKKNNRIKVTKLTSCSCECKLFFICIYYEAKFVHVLYICSAII